MATSTTALDADRLAAAEPSQLIVTWRRFRRHRLALFGLGVLTFMVATSFLAPWIAPYDPTVMEPGAGFSAISAQHWLGTDSLGRDTLTRLMYAGRISLTIGLACTFIVIIFGSLFGAISGFFGGVVDTLMMRLVDLMLSVPTLPLLIALSQMLNAILPSMVTIIFVLSL